MIADYRRNHPAPNLDALHGRAPSGGGSMDDSNDEAMMARVRSQWAGAPTDFTSGDMKPLPPMTKGADPGAPPSRG